MTDRQKKMSCYEAIKEYVHTYHTIQISIKRGIGSDIETENESDNKQQVTKGLN